MSNSESDLAPYWHKVKRKMSVFDKLDDADLVFAARSSHGGHKYEFLPTVTDREILDFESRNQLVIPSDFKGFLRICGAGGAGPAYGIKDFREFVLPKSFDTPFPYSESIGYTADLSDEEPVWSRPGLAFICEAGCGTDYYIELNGSTPGQIWVDGNEAFSLVHRTFLEFYNGWLVDVDLGLTRYRRLKQLIGDRSQTSTRSLTFNDVVSHMRCNFCWSGYDGRSGVPEGEVWVHFEKTPGKVTLNENLDILKIDCSDRCWIPTLWDMGASGSDSVSSLAKLKSNYAAS